jgi:hypothetical protein
MAQLNLRKVPDSLIIHLKTAAAERNMTLTALCIERLTPGAQQESSPAKQSQVEQNPVQDATISQPVRVKACSECFAMGGMHFRGCKNG